MYTAHWGLEKPPFVTGTAEQVFFTGVPQQEALARLRFLVHQQRRLGLLLGEMGQGKSLILEMFAEECAQENWLAAKISLVGLSVREFEWELATELGAAPRLGDDSLRLTRRVEERLRQTRWQGERTIVLLDDVDQAGVDVMTQIQRFASQPTSRVGNLTLILAVNSKQINRLGARLFDLVDLRIDLDAWDAQDTIGYLQLALVAAGAERPVFEESALAEIHRLTKGVPRYVNRLADYALVAGSSAGLDVIDEQTVTAAHEEIFSG